MRETFYRIVLMLAFVGMFLGGGAIMGQTNKWSKETPRAVTLVDAYESYSDTGKPYWTGIFRDKALNTRFEWSIEPKTYREFTATNQPQAMVVTASRDRVNDPTTPTGKRGIAGGLIFLGIGGFFFNLFAVFFLRDPWRFS